VLPWFDGFFKAGKVNDSIPGSANTGNKTSQEYGTIEVHIKYGGFRVKKPASYAPAAFFGSISSNDGKEIQESDQSKKDNKKFWATPSLSSEWHYGTWKPTADYSNGIILDGSEIKFRYDTKERLELRLLASGTCDCFMTSNNAL
jgi:hypothetical protein